MDKEAIERALSQPTLSSTQLPYPSEHTTAATTSSSSSSSKTVAVKKGKKKAYTTVEQTATSTPPSSADIDIETAGHSIDEVYTDFESQSSATSAAVAATTHTPADNKVTKAEQTGRRAKRGKVDEARPADTTLTATSADSAHTDTPSEEAAPEVKAEGKRSLRTQPKRKSFE